MTISNNRVVVEKIEEEAKEGFKIVSINDSFVCRGKVVMIPEQPVFMGNRQVAPGDTVLFAKYSPDTHLIELGGKDVKFILTTDILAVV